MGTGVGGCQAVDVRTEKEPAIVTGTDVRLAPWNSGLFLEAGRLATVIGGGGMRGSSSRVTA